MWNINELHVQQLEAVYGSAAEKLFFHPALATKPSAQPPADSPSPVEVAILKTVVDRLDLSWGKTDDVVGSLQGIKAVGIANGPGGKALQVNGEGGRFQQANWPELPIKSFRFEYSKPLLRLEHADLLGPGANGGDISIDGQAQFVGPTPLDIELRASHCRVEPFLPQSSRGKLQGVFGGKVALHKDLASEEAVRAEGDVEMTDGILQGFAALDKIAALTHKPEFRHLHLQTVHPRFVFEQSRLQVKAFHAEAKGLVCVDGEFTIEQRRIDGLFQLGTTASVLSAIPGAREKVFTEARDGYLWTAVKVTGPLDAPQENLKTRLVKAAQEQIAKDVLRPAVAPGEGVLDLLRQL